MERDNSKKKRVPKIDLADDNFGTMLVCAVRYAIGRRSYMPSLVCDFITPLLPYLRPNTLGCMERDIIEHGEYGFGYGDRCDEVAWMRLYSKIRHVMTEREIELWPTGYGRENHPWFKGRGDSEQ